jgi:Sulfatase
VSATAAATASAPARPAGMFLPAYRWRFAHLAALWGYGVSQPVFSMLKGNPEFLVVRGSTRLDVVTFALLVAFVPPLAVVGFEAIVSLVSRTLGGVVHIIAVWCFGCLAVLQIVRLLDIQRGAALLIPLVPATLAAFAYLKSRIFRSFLSVSFVLPVLGALSFLVTVPLAVDDAAAVDIQVPKSTPVVLVVMDEFPLSSLLRPDGSIDAGRYPNFARLAKSATWYPRATTVHEFTTQAVPAVLTGQQPHTGELPTLGDHPRNLFTLLGARYALRVIEPVTHLCPTRYCPDAHVRAPLVDRARGLLYDTTVGYLYRVLPAALRQGLPPIGDRWGGFDNAGDAGTRQRLLGALDVNDVNLAIERSDHQPRTEFARFLRLIRPHAPDRTLYFLHFMLPHAPYRLLSSGREYGNAETIDGIQDDAFNQWSDAPLLVDQARQRLLLQVGYTDRLIGDLVRRLKAAGLYDSALIVLTADHGASFHAGGFRRTVSPENIGDIAPVPLFVKYPGQHEGVKDTRNAKTIDIVPTIADVLGTRLPWHVDGASLRGTPVQGRRVVVWRRSGGAVTTTPALAWARVLETARHDAQLFGVGVEPTRPIGPDSKLVGREVGALGAATASGAHVRLDGETLFANVRKASEFVPARITGEVDGVSLAGEAPLAVAVNDRVTATTRTFVVDGRSRFAVLVPESAFREGRNKVDVFAISADGGATRLARLGGTSNAADYVLSANGRRLTSPGRAAIRVVSGRLDGRIESSTEEGGTVRIKGWAADLHDRALVDRVVLFSDGKLIFSSATTVYRWDVDEVQNKTPAARVGFVAEIPSRDVEGGNVRIFAIRGAVASELPWPVGSEPQVSPDLAAARVVGR